MPRSSRLSIRIGRQRHKAIHGVDPKPNGQLLDAVFPGVPRRRDVGVHDTLLSIDKARRMLGWEPTHGWRTTV